MRKLNTSMGSVCGAVAGFQLISRGLLVISNLPLTKVMHVRKANTGCAWPLDLGFRAILSALFDISNFPPTKTCPLLSIIMGLLS
jgi:hypothetical protein